MYTHSSPGGRGTELDFGKPWFFSLVPSGCCCMAAGQADGLRSSPFSLLSFLFSLFTVPTDPPTNSQVTDSPLGCVHVCMYVHVFDKNQMWGSEKRLDCKSMWTSGTVQERDRMRKRMKGFNFCRWEGETKCSECDLMVMLRWGLGVQILLVTAVQTCYSVHSQAHTHTHQGKTHKQGSQTTESTHSMAYKNRNQSLYLSNSPGLWM